MRNTNPNPHLTKFLVGSGAFRGDPLRVMDVGARGGIEAHWRHFGGDVRLVGFEPDQDECDRLNRASGASGATFYPVALHRDRGRRKFHLMANPPSSSFYEPDSHFWNRFPDARNLEVIDTTSMETVDLDSYAQEQNIPTQDFIKMDVEGAEHDVLLGASSSLESVLGLSLEVEFRPVFVGQMPFAVVDSLLRDSGFYLFDMWPHRNARSIMSPAVHWDRPGQTGTGQLFWAHVLYLRDPIEEVRDTASVAQWPKSRLLKQACLMEIANLNDCAAELIDYMHQASQITGEERDRMLDLVTIGGEGSAGAYERFREKSKLDADITAGRIAAPVPKRSVFKRAASRGLRPLNRWLER